MRPPRLLLLIFCFIFLPILLTLLSLVTAEPRRGVVEGEAPIAGRSSRLRALFSFNTPTSLFPPSAIISLTDDNSTFFLARPAAFGPLLPSKGLSGQLWIGSGFNEDTLRKGVGTAGFQGELGCSDIPGWDKDEQSKKDQVSKAAHTNLPASLSTDKEMVDKRKSADTSAADKISGPAPNDGTDDHLHQPISASKDEKASEKQPPTHADIQSLQESAEIAGKVVLLSRGGCGFLEKVKWVQQRGGIALIVGDDTRGGSLITMYARGDTSNITIPAVFTSYTTAHLLSSLIPERASLEGKTDSKKVSPKQKRPAQPTTTTTRIASQPTTTKVPKKDTSEKKEVRKTKDNYLFSALWSLFGWGRDNSITDDSHRPPSSGNIDWVLIDEYDEEDVSKSKSMQSSKDKGAKTDKSPKNSDNKLANDDGFEIGVHDWRDPDLVPTKSPKGKSSSAGKTEFKEKVEKADSKMDANFKGGSITPGSGEYSHMVKVPAGTDKDKSVIGNGGKLSSDKSKSDEKSWFARHFGWNQGLDDELDQILKNRVQPASDEVTYVREGKQVLDDHPGLWVTLTPTSMSTSPFFDTLLVLVVSPLITLTVVYALLLLRSRIRRRRWRAPKSVVERLPIRTYHTITTHSTSTSNSPRSPSPGSVTSVTSTSPLLGSRPREAQGRSRQRSQTVSGTNIRTHDATPVKEGVFSGSDLWRRKYIGRQVECVVCLEEYVDGQSQVMSLPCGHEFHAECITPWLTTRRRTCPICKGDVVRSMALAEPTTPTQEHTSSTRTASVHILPDVSDDSNLEEGRRADEPLPSESHNVNDNAASSSTPHHSNWRNIPSMTFSVLSGDGMWHSRNDRSR
ncbi:PA and RING finger domain protein [Talaromyces stipitatus ATCC 10500]|uniref:PA and RING finger domain protein n=1 Tax=Talaromyces stipitatus (strain ATCC 10500 / CBS 375.48 / QM 6759 / NRRL 1006) TaxID=441959 RepID=B8M6V2_TALSN|nr:PA and RING finger domain protein [Talaromyces stipitatus ATCC 10500]EED20172.1 PA and RING finger domain protein [Talaromyces stipitatus ATCC 10500]